MTFSNVIFLVKIYCNYYYYPGHEVQKKWANLRTCFRRELNAQKNTKSGQAATKRRKYVYFEKLLFLLPCLENRQTEGNLEPNDSHEDEDDNNAPGPSSSTPIPRRKKRTNVPKPDDLDEALIKALNQTVDEDTNFALSLVPSLQNLNAEEKLDAKIGILNIFKQITLARRFETSSQSTSSYNVLQRPLSYPVYHPGANNIMPPPQLSQHSSYTSSFTPTHSLPTFQDIQNTPSPENSNDTVRSHFSNFSDNTEIYDL